MPQTSTSASPRLWPPSWLWWADELIPNWVKNRYSPKESWKDKPFTEIDARFFSKGILELSELFTTERPGRVPDYFVHPRFRSAYLLYFLPLQAAKFLTLFEQHPQALKAALASAQKTGALRVADLGAGPGTASLALLLWLSGQRDLKEIPPIEFDWVDTEGGIMKDGQALALEFADHFPKLRGKVTVRTHVAPWWKAATVVPRKLSLILVGHLLNEASAKKLEQNLPVWNELLDRTSGGGGALFVEPAAKGPSQHLSQLRDLILESGEIDQESSASAESIWGPCLHAGRCPLAHGRDWCHFSVNIDIPGKWFRSFSKALGSERHWLKYSYLWFSSPGAPAPVPAKSQRRVISDPLGDNSILLCEPERPRKIPTPKIGKVFRGDLIKVGAER